MILEKIDTYRFSNREEIYVQFRRNGYSLFRKSDRKPIARLRTTEIENDFEVLYWSYRNKWESIGDFGGIILVLDKALEYIDKDPMECFWI